MTAGAQESRTVLHIDADAVSALSVFRGAIERAECRYLGVATCGRSGLKAAAALKPDLVVLDLELPDLDGHSVLAALRSLSPAPLILALTARADDATLYHAARGSLDGILWKSPLAARELPKALEAVLNGAPYFPLPIREAIRSLRCAPDCFFKILSEHELELLPLLGAGQSDQDIARAVSLSPASIHSHRQRIMGKLGVHTTVDLMRWALARGFVHIARPAAPSLQPDWIAN